MNAGQHSLDVLQVSLVDDVDQWVIFGVEIEANLAVCFIGGGNGDGNVCVAVVGRELQVCSCLVVHVVAIIVDGHCHFVFLLAGGDCVEGVLAGGLEDQLHGGVVGSEVEPDAGCGYCQ
jgi:hypothetical protein